MTKTVDERTSKEASEVADWKTLVPKNRVLGWKVYEGPEIPVNDEQREQLRSLMLTDLWLLKKALKDLPRHLRFTVEQFDEGFSAECQNRWYPLVQGIDTIAHHWRHLYPGIDITRRSAYADIAKLMNNLLEPGKLSPENFDYELHKLASQFRTYDMCYFPMIDDEVIKEKLSILVKVLSTVAEHYHQDWEHAVQRANQPAQFSPPT